MARSARSRRPSACDTLCSGSSFSSSVSSWVRAGGILRGTSNRTKGAKLQEACQPCFVSRVVPQSCSRCKQIAGYGYEDPASAARPCPSHGCKATQPNRCRWQGTLALATLGFRPDETQTGTLICKTTEMTGLWAYITVGDADMILQCGEGTDRRSRTSSAIMSRRSSAPSSWRSRSALRVTLKVCTS